VAVCRVGGRDIGAELVREGWALDYRRYSGGAYAADQAAARAERAGLWAGEFITQGTEPHRQPEASPYADKAPVISRSNALLSNNFSSFLSVFFSSAGP
jgi:endonuclease YncB( thermonuclease family)